MLFGKSTINIGMQAPDFQLPDQDSTIHKLSDYIGSTIVLYFFPMADTPGWTKEACGFRDKFEIYESANTKIIGVSFDTPDKLKTFRDKYNIPYTFLSDRKKTVARMYDAKGWFFPKRVTFIIDETGTIQKIIRNVNVHTHGEDILEMLGKSDK